MSAVLLLFDGLPVQVEYGNYEWGQDPEYLSRQDSRFGLKGQGLVYARPLQHDLWNGWALSKVPRQEREIDENYTRRGESSTRMNYRACVINFDKTEN